ncbi:MAG TPA: TRAM domain-containing protein [Thermoanaerobaculia bacterium]|nr:TRAM domain-containing protein [Thermoanaerobaculia bacterium]
MTQPGDLVELSPDRLVAGGDAMARLDGMPVFIRGAYPGDRIRGRITEVKKGFLRAEVEQLLQESRERRFLPCPIAAECGGCDWTELRLDRQIHWKREILSDALRRIGKFDLTNLPPITIHVSPLNYRLRSRIHVDEESGAIGFFAMRSTRVIPLVEECEVVGPAVIAALVPIRAAAAEQRPESVETLENGRELLVNLRPVGAKASGEIQLDVGGHSYRFSTRSFFQVNRHLLQTLHDLISRSATQSPRRKLAWDLYGGVGFFALPLGKIFERVESVESDGESAQWGRANTSGIPNVRMITADVEHFLGRKNAPPDFVAVDPPRAGLAPEVLQGVAQIKAARICYLSCDPVTFSRDAARLARHGWALTSIDLIDLFPNTHHIETLGSFVHEEGSG